MFSYTSTKEEAYSMPGTSDGDDLNVGYSVVQLKFVADTCFKLAVSHSTCCSGTFALTEQKSANMKTHMFVTCNVCGHRRGFFSEPFDTVAGKAAAFATVSAGSGFEQALKLFSVMGVQFMDAKTFSRNLKDCPTLLQKSLDKIMLENCELERQMAIECNDVSPDGTAQCPVIIDGGYSMHNNRRFIGQSCAVSNFGGRTKQLLDLRIANSRCKVCKKAKKNNTVVPLTHKCYKTTDRQDSMETDLTIASFRESEKKCKFRFRQLISDSDTAVYSRIKKSNPYAVEKADCVVHVKRTLKAHLYKITKKTNIPIVDRKVIGLASPRIIAAAQVAMKRSGCAIDSNLKNTQDKVLRQQARSRIISELAHDLSVCGLHGVGYHGQCRRAICPLPGTISSELEQELMEILYEISKENLEVAVANLCDIREELGPKKNKIVGQLKRALEAQISMKKANLLYHAFDNHSDCPKEICRLYRVGSLSTKTQTILTDEMGFLVAKAQRLVENQNSNIAESFVAMSNMMLNGRRTNVQDGQVYTRQILLSGLTMSRGYSWHAEVQKSMGIKPTRVLDKFAQRICLRRKLDKVKKRSRIQYRRAAVSTSGYKQEKATDAFSDVLSVSSEILQANRLKKMQTIDINVAQHLINVESVDFLDAVRDRMLSTAIAELLVYKKAVPSKFLLSKLLTPTFVPWHITEKSVAKLAIEIHKQCTIAPCGLFISPEVNFLAAKPDGLINELNATYRFLKKRQDEIYLGHLAQADMFCSGMKKAVIVCEDEMFEFDQDSRFAIHLERIEIFYTTYLLPFFITGIAP